MTPDSNYVFEKGTILVYPGGGGAATPLLPGATGQVLGFDPTTPLGCAWGAGSASGNVVGPVSSTAHHLAAFADTSGALLEDSGVATASVALGAGSSTAGHLISFASTDGKTMADSGKVAASVVIGPASAVGNNFASFNSTTGKIIEDSGVNANSFAPVTGAANGQIIKTTYPAGDYVVLLTDYLVFATTSAARAITLPTAPPEGTTFIIKDVTGTAATHNITVSGAVNIDGASTNVISTNYAKVKYTYSVTNSLWYTS